MGASFVGVVVVQVILDSLYFGHVSLTLNVVPPVAVASVAALVRGLCGQLGASAWWALLTFNWQSQGFASCGSLFRHPYIYLSHGTGVGFQ